MPIVVIQTGTGSAATPASIATTLASDIISRVKEDLKDTFTASGSTSVLIDYIDRVQKMILSRRRWKWMMSAPKRFITERGQTQYWIGQSGSSSAGQVDTGLNLLDVRQVKQGSVLSRSGYVTLYPVDEAPLFRGWQQPDGSYTEGPPRNYRNDTLTPSLLEVYPAPDQGNSYELVPQAPHSTTASGGALAARTYFIRTSFVDLEGNEGALSPTARQFVEASKLITIKAPQPAINVGLAGVSYLRWNVYIGTEEGSETKQNTSLTATSADWTEPASGLIAGAALPTSADMEPLRGYVIEFRYYKQHTQVTGTGDTLFIPNDFSDVVVAGVNWMACKYLKGEYDEDVPYWYGLFKEGLVRMSQNENPWPAPGDFISPDMAAKNKTDFLRTPQSYGTT